MHCTAQSLTLVAYFQTIVHGSQRSHLSGSQPARQGCTDWVEQNAQGKEVSSQSQSFLGGPAMAREAGRSGDSHVTMQGQVPDGAFWLPQKTLPIAFYSAACFISSLQVLIQNTTLDQTYMNVRVDASIYF